MLLGAHVFFFREGDTLTFSGTSGVASASNKPNAADTAWIDLGLIDEASFGLEETDIEVWGPQPGRLRLANLLSTKEKITFKFTCGELSPLAVETQLRTLALSSSSTQFNPGEGVLKKGWLKAQLYDQNDAQRIVLDVWSRLKMAGDISVGGADLVKPQFEALVLHSIYNTGTL
jgi:hypothetical protein